MLLICPVRPGDKNEELRYAMRSWETNLIVDQKGDGRGGVGLELLIVGDKPDWCEPDYFVAGNDQTSMPVNVWMNVLKGSVYARDLGYEQAVYMNDDFFCMDPVGAILPVKRNCTLAEHIAQFPVSASNWWTNSLRLTASFVAEAGFPHPDSFEVHRPLAAAPSGMIEALSRWDRGYKDGLPQWRTVYGVLNEVTAYPVIDAKLGGRSQGIGTPWLSTSDNIWRVYASTMRQRFQKPSRWEKN